MNSTAVPCSSRSAPQQVDHLGLDGHVQRARRLVGQQHAGPQRHGQRDGEPLRLPAGHLVRVAAQDAGSRLTSASASRMRAGRPHPVQRQRALEVAAQPHRRVQRRPRGLHDHGDPAPAQRAQPALRRAHELLALQRDRAAHASRRPTAPARGWPARSSTCPSRSPPPAPTISPRVEVQRRHAGDDARRRTRSPRRAARSLAASPSGRAASRRPSPSRLKPTATITIASPGGTATHQFVSSSPWPWLTIRPHSGVGSCAPSPRNDSAAAVSMIPAASRDSCTSVGGMRVGQHVAGEHARARDAERPRGLDVAAPGDRRRAAPGQPGVPRPPGDRDGQRRVLGARRQHRGQRERQQQRREGQEDVGDPHDHVVHPAAGGAGDDPQRHADQRGQHEHAEHDQQRRARAVDHPREHVAAELVGAEDVPVARRGQRVRRDAWRCPRRPGRA